MTAVQEEIKGFEAVLDRLERALAEGRPQTAYFGDSDFQVLYHRISQFFHTFCATMTRLEARAHHSPNPVFARLYAEADALAQSSDALHWGLDLKSGWDVHFLELDFQLRMRRTTVLAALETFRDQALLPLLARWREADVLVAA